MGLQYPTKENYKSFVGKPIEGTFKSTSSMLDDIIENDGNGYLTVYGENDETFTAYASDGIIDHIEVEGDYTS